MYVREIIIAKYLKLLPTSCKYYIVLWGQTSFLRFIIIIIIVQYSPLNVLSDFLIKSIFIMFCSQLRRT